jgi:hypothetical protein
MSFPTFIFRLKAKPEGTLILVLDRVNIYPVAISYRSLTLEFDWPNEEGIYIPPCELLREDIITPENCKARVAAYTDCTDPRSKQICDIVCGPEPWSLLEKQLYE